MSCRAYTIIELCVTLLIISLLLSTGIPAFSRFVDSHRIQTSSNLLLDAVQASRTTAVQSNRRVTLRADGQWNTGWVAFFDDNHNGERDGDEAVIAMHRHAQSQVNIIPNTPLTRYISFLPSGESRYATGRFGGGFQAGKFIICSVSDAQKEGIEMVLARSGRMRLRTITVQSCPQP